MSRKSAMVQYRPRKASARKAATSGVMELVPSQLVTPLAAALLPTCSWSLR
jgi:hypothetical protein